MGRRRRENVLTEGVVISETQTGLALLLLGGILAAAPLLVFADRRPGASRKPPGFTINACVMGIMSVVIGVLLIVGVL